MFTNVAGGVRVSETGADLAVVLAILSSLKNRALGSDIVVFGEVGLSGELRPVQRGLDRLNEARKLGFRRALVPQANKPRQALSDLEILAPRRIEEALEIFDI